MEKVLRRVSRFLDSRSGFEVPVVLFVPALLIAAICGLVGAYLGAQQTVPTPVSITITETTTEMEDGFAAVGAFDGRDVLVRGADLVAGQTVPAYVVADDLPGDYVYTVEIPNPLRDYAVNSAVLGTVAGLLLVVAVIMGTFFGESYYDRRRARSQAILDAALR